MAPMSVRIHLVRPEELPEDIRSALDAGGRGIIRAGGKIYRRAGESILFCDDSVAGEALMREIGSLQPEKALGNDPWRELLTGSTDAESGISGIRDDLRRCVILFRAAPMQDKRLKYETFAETVPMEPGDVMTEVSPGTIALIKQAEDHTEEEIAEFTAAVAETAGIETGIRVQAGVGRFTRRTAGMRESFLQAAGAMETGRKFRLEGPVFIYNRQTAERILSSIPAAEREALRSELFTPETRKLMNDEMTETVDVFFRNDLNLSTAARQLFIHRNTLIYRLDKIRKATGFDLRNFRDAAVFQMLIRLPED